MISPRSTRLGMRTCLQRPQHNAHHNSAMTHTRTPVVHQQHAPQSPNSAPPCAPVRSTHKLPAKVHERTQCITEELAQPSARTVGDTRLHLRGVPIATQLMQRGHDAAHARGVGGIGPGAADHGGLPLDRQGQTHRGHECGHAIRCWGSCHTQQLGKDACKLQGGGDKQHHMDM
jgi:hypothetical protein